MIAWRLIFGYAGRSYRRMNRTETNITVRYAETDQMGIAHHSNYPIWFEAGRTDMIRKIGYPYSKLEKRGLRIPLIELKCKYRNAAKYEDELLVATEVRELTFSRITFHYEIIRKSDRAILATGETVHVWTNANMKPVNLKKYMPEVYESISKACLT